MARDRGLSNRGRAYEAVTPNAKRSAPVGSTPGHRDFWISLLLALACLLIYNANLRSISAADTYPARYLPFGIWKHHTITLDPISTIAAQGRRIARLQGKTNSAFWIVLGREDRRISLYPVVVPVLIAPLYLPAVAYLDHRGWDLQRFDRTARIMEKLSASLLAAFSAALLYLLLRRRAEPPVALALAIAFAFGTTTWVISSQALWTHGLAQLLIIAALLLLTGPCTAVRAIAAGCFIGLVACNRQPDAILAAALGLYGVWWARRLAPLLVLGAALPVGLVVAYNLEVVGHLVGAYGLLVGKESFFEHDLLPGLAGLLVSPTRGLFVFSPFLLLLLIYPGRLVRDREFAGLTVILGVGVVLQLLMYAKADWRQGTSWGPRWLTDMLPILFWMLAPIVSTLSRIGRAAFIAACGIAIAIQTIGAFWYTGTSDAAIYATADGPDKLRAAWDIRNAPFVAELRHAPAPAELATGLRGHIDVVAAHHGDSATATDIEVEGWTLASRRTPWEVVALLDGQVAASTTTFFPRPDVVTALGLASPSGWRIIITADDLPRGEHVISILVRANEGGDLRFLGDRRFMTAAAPQTDRNSEINLADSAQRAVEILVGRQQGAGYWLTSHTQQARFRQPRQELNVFTNAMMIDIIGPVVPAGLDESVRRARAYLAGQIEDGGLVRYHGRPDGPTIGTLGCAITPDADDTALVWRIAPGANPELLPMAFETLAQFRTPDGLYRTWLASPDHYQCIDPGKDPNPADVVIQMHVLMLLAQEARPAADALCAALGQAINEDRIWVYYKSAPLVPLLRQADLQRAQCPLQLPPPRLQTSVRGQEIWVDAAQLLARLQGASQPPAQADEVNALLHTIAADDFSLLRRSPPLLYHNDLTASVSRFYWSEELGYALWLRLLSESERLQLVNLCRQADDNAACGAK
jgi:hypothetical protein